MLTALALSLALVTPALAREASPSHGAEKWLGLIDEGRYADSWREAGQTIKQRVTLAQWVQTMIAVRKPMGRILKRSLARKKFFTSLPGAPDGKYWVMVFATSFSNKKKALETVTFVKEKDGVWRSSGYYIK